MRYENATSYNQAERRSGGAAERRSGGAAGRRGGAWILPAVIAALLAFMLLAIQPAAAQTVDYDADDDGLIDITTPQQLNAIRHDPNGNGDATDGDYVAAFLNRDTNSATRMGCPSGTCTGYELRANIDLSTDYATWTPIPSFATTLRGNGHTISGLNVSTSTALGSAHAGFILTLASGGFIREVGLINPSVRSTTVDTGNNVGGLVAEMSSGSRIYHSFARGGTVRGTHSSRVGGLAGYNAGTIRASYSAVTATTGNDNGHYIGGLVGWLSSGSIQASYSAGVVVAGTGQNVRAGRGIGRSSNASSSISNSYCDSSIAGPVNNNGEPICIFDETGGSNVTMTAVTSRDLKRPTGYTGIYANWDVDTDGVSGNDDPWDFGTRRNYPLLKVDKDGDGTATCLEFSGQPCYVYVPPSPPPYNPAHDHPEIYQNARYEMAVSCEVRTTGTGDEAVSTSTLTFDLGDYTRPLTLALSLWDGDVFRSLQSQGITMPELRQDGQTATVEVVTDPAQTRFRLDSEYGLNLVLGYADCHTDDP